MNTMMNIVKANPKFWSNLFDALILAADFIAGYWIYPWFNSQFVKAGSVSGKNAALLCGVALLLTVMYAAGLLINRVNFRAEERVRFSSWDGLALLFNVVLLSAVFTVIIMGMFPAAENPVVIIILAFGFMAAWFFLHWHIVNKESSKSGDKPSLKRKLLGFLLVLPFVAGLSIPLSVIADGMNLYKTGEAINLSNALLYPLFAGTLLALLAWFLYFIPRKMLKGFMGANIRSRYFLVGLVIIYAFQLSSIRIKYISQLAINPELCSGDVSEQKNMRQTTPQLAAGNLSSIMKFKTHE